MSGASQLRSSHRAAATATVPAAAPAGALVRALVRAARIGLGGVLALTLAGCVVRVDDGPRERQEKRFTTKGRPTVQLATFKGSIVIRGWDRSEVSVEVEKRGRDDAAVAQIEIVADQQGDTIHLEARKKDDGEKRSYGMGWSAIPRSARLVASVPTGSDLIVRTGDGSIRVEHVNGKVELKSSDGSVTGTDLTGDVVAHTEDGSIRLENLDGKCDAASEDGSIAVQGRLDGLRVSTDDGSVVVRAQAGSKLAREWSVSTGDGSMVLYLTDAIGADLDAQAQDGSVKLDGALAFARDGGSGSNMLRGRLGPGGPRLMLRSGDGSIRVRRLAGGPPPPPPPPPHPPSPDTPVER